MGQPHRSQEKPVADAGSGSPAGSTEYATRTNLAFSSFLTGSPAMVRSRHEQLIGPKLGKEYDEAVYCHPVYLTYMQRISCEMLGWMNHKLE